MRRCRISLLGIVTVEVEKAVKRDEGNLRLQYVIVPVMKSDLFR